MHVGNTECVTSARCNLRCVFRDSILYLGELRGKYFLSSLQGIDSWSSRSLADKKGIVTIGGWSLGGGGPSCQNHSLACTNNVP